MEHGAWTTLLRMLVPPRVLPVAPVLVVLDIEFAPVSIRAAQRHDS